MPDYYWSSYSFLLFTCRCPNPHPGRLRLDEGGGSGWFNRAFGRTSWANAGTDWAMVRRAGGFGWTGNWRWTGGAVARMMVVILVRSSWFNTTG
jgi:hypothetical protein